MGGALSRAGVPSSSWLDTGMRLALTDPARYAVTLNCWQTSVMMNNEIQHGLILAKGAELRETSVLTSSVKSDCIRVRDYKGQALLTSAINRVLSYICNIVCCVLSKKNEMFTSLITSERHSVHKVAQE